MSGTHIATRDGQKTVYNPADLPSALSSGTIPSDAIFWQEGMAEWRPVAELEYGTASPSASQPPPIAQQQQSRYAFTKDPAKLTSVLVFLVYAQAVVALFNMFSDMAQLALLGSSNMTETAIAANDARQQLLGGGYLLVYFVTAIVFLMWINRANKNCHGFSSGMEFTSGWAVGWYFVPIACLIKPFQVMNEIWRVSHDPVNWKSLATPALLRWWWGLWLLGCVFGQLSFRMTMNAKTLDALQASTTISIMSSILDLPLCLVAVVMVGKILKAQTRLVAGSR